MFDSNGFAHTHQDAPTWNPVFQVFADYEYFLQCLDRWGRDQFGLHEQVLVDYVQSSQGVIGRSSYHQWALELQRLLNQHSPILTQPERAALTQWVQCWQDKADQGRAIPAFTEVKDL